MQATYTHDNLGRLTQIVFDTGQSVVYNYDSVGNRTSVTQVGSFPATDGDPSICNVRACLTQGDPWGLIDVNNGSVLYVEPIYDGRIGIWNGTATYNLKVNAFSLNLAGLAVGNYRLYVFDSNDDAIVDAGELAPWTNDTSPPADTLTADGYLVKSTATNRRAVADILIGATGSPGDCDWTDTGRGICHIDERVRRPAILKGLPNLISWEVPASTSWREILQAGPYFILSTNSFVSADGIILAEKAGGSGTYKYELGFGLDTTTANSAIQPFGYDESVVGASNFTAKAKFRSNVAAGKHFLRLIEQNLTNRVVTAHGRNGDVFRAGCIVKVML